MKIEFGGGKITEAATINAGSSEIRALHCLRSGIELAKGKEGAF